MADTDSNAFRLELDAAIKDAHGAVDEIVAKFEAFLEVRVNELTPEATEVVPPVVPETPVNQTLSDATTSVVSEAAPSNLSTSTPDTSTSTKAN